MTENIKTDSNINAALSYLLPPITGILFFALEKEDKYVKFHSFQSILFGITVIGLNYIFSMFYIPVFGYLMLKSLGLLSFVLWIMLMWKAYNNEKYELPYLGKISKEQTYK